MTKEETVFDQPCPDCKAKPGKPCTSSRGPTRQPHKERQRRFDKHRQEQRRLEQWNQTCTQPGETR